ncbi:MAG: hypothetical protein Q7S25_04435 [Candidatus Limnocylindria bacterium]|nr:hypothetical protein [Candidatus Limnocylindria bacterium]
MGDERPPQGKPRRLSPEELRREQEAIERETQDRLPGLTPGGVTRNEANNLAWMLQQEDTRKLEEKDDERRTARFLAVERERTDRLVRLLRPMVAGAVVLVFIVGAGWRFVGLGPGGPPSQSAAPSAARGQPATTAGSAASAPRAPRPQPIVAVFNQASFATRYAVSIDNPDDQALTLTWAGPNCGTWDNQAGHQSPTGLERATLVDMMLWTHPHPPCAATSNHSEVTVTLTIGYRGGSLVCAYSGSESGNGTPCRSPDAQRR